MVWAWWIFPTSHLELCKFHSRKNVDNMQTSFETHKSSISSKCREICDNSQAISNNISFPAICYSNHWYIGNLFSKIVSYLVLASFVLRWRINASAGVTLKFASHTCRRQHLKCRVLVIRLCLFPVSITKRLVLRRQCLDHTRGASIVLPVSYDLSYFRPVSASLYVQFQGIVVCLLWLPPCPHADGNRGFLCCWRWSNDGARIATETE